MRSVYIAVLGLALCGPLYAQGTDSPSRLSLSDALRIAEERNPQIVAARAQVAIAGADQVSAATRPNPAFSINSEDYPLFGSNRPPLFQSQEIVVRLDQEIERGGRRRLRIEAAEAGTRSARAWLEDARRLLALDVQRAYFQLVLARADHDVATASLAEIDRVIAINRARFEQGEIAGGEMRRIQVERLRFVDDVFAAELSAKNATSALLTLMHAPALDRVIVPTETLDPPVVALSAPSGAVQAGQRIDVAALATLALAQRSDLAAAREDLRRADTETQLQRALRTPNLTIGGGYKRNVDSNGIALGVTIPLPIFNRNAGGVARADAERQLAESRMAATTSAIALDVQQAANAVDVNRERVAYIEREYLQNAREARDIVLASYRSGAATLIDYLDAQRALREALRIENRARFEYRISIVQLDAAVGRSATVEAAK